MYDSQCWRTAARLVSSMFVQMYHALHEDNKAANQETCHSESTYPVTLSENSRKEVEERCLTH